MTSHLEVITIYSLAYDALIPKNQEPTLNLFDVILGMEWNPYLYQPVYESNNGHWIIGKPRALHN